MRTTERLELAALAFILGLEVALLARVICELDRRAVPDERWFIFGPAVPEQAADPCEAAVEARRRAWLEERPDEVLPPELRDPPPAA